MQNFIVLGLVPGTNIQITLNLWLGVTAGVLFLLVTPRLILAIDTVRRYFVMRKIARTINRFDLISL